MTASKSLSSLFLTSLFLVITGYTPSPPLQIIPTAQPETTPAFIGITKTAPPLVQAKNESVEDLVARIAATRISYSFPVLIVFTEMQDEESFWFGATPSLKDAQKCWFYTSDSVRECTSEETETFFVDDEIPKIHFAHVYSNSEKSLFILDYFHRWVDRNDYVDGYRLVLEFKNGKWVEKSIISMY